MRYLVVRALLFLVPFAVLMIAQVPWLLSLLVSIAFAFAASIVFFGKLRQEAAADLQRMREGRKRDGAGPDDGDIEDAALDTAEPFDGREPAGTVDAPDAALPADTREPVAADGPGVAHDASQPVDAHEPDARPDRAERSDGSTPDEPHASRP
ncbi:hypothetical protein GCM10009640_22290 [Agrococcus citreus]|uniref:DUF4229 domain-containing protein n=2 Tax=Agrococcus citreus TaxID=84643 RepID=A0ABN1YXN5_9MICO